MPIEGQIPDTTVPEQPTTEVSPVEPSADIAPVESVAAITEPVTANDPVGEAAQPEEVGPSEERHVFDFEQHQTLTQEDVHQMSEVQKEPQQGEEEVRQLREENGRLRDEVEQLQGVIRQQEEEMAGVARRSEELIRASEEQLGSLRDHSALQEEVAHLREQLARTEGERA